MVDTLITRDSKGKIRQINISCEKEDNIYILKRSSGLYKGKFIVQPEIIIDKGKAKRTLDEQAVLIYNSNIKSYLDKGYRKIADFGYLSIDDFDPEEVLPKEKTDQAGIVKPMLAKLIQSVPESTLKKYTDFYISRKVDGVRCILYFKDGEVLSASRGGGDYNYATTHIRQHPQLVEFFKKNPNIQLDGELYVFGVSLQNLSGCARLEEGKLPFKLQYYIYDVVDTEKDFSQRINILTKVKEDLNLTFVPERTFEEDDLYIQILPQAHIKNDPKIYWELHNKYVNEGWEGAVLRLPDKKYNPGARDMIKLKSRLDGEFKTIGYELGLRGIEDIVFKMETSDGKQFKAKPMGSKEVKESLFKDINNIIGKMATCTYFYLSDDGTPLQPVWKSIRLDKDI